MPSAPAFVDRVVEFYTLRRASSAQEKLGPARAEIADLCELGRQQANAAEALFAVGHTVEALRLGLEALGALKEAADRFGEATRARSAGATPPSTAAAAPSLSAADASTGSGGAASGGANDDGTAASGDAAGATATGTAAPQTESSAAERAPTPEPRPAEPAWRTALHAAALSAAAIEACEGAIARADTTEVPRLESGITPAHAVFFRELMRARTALQTVVAPATLSRAEIGFTRGWRPLVTAVLVLGSAYGLFQALRPVEGTFVRVSSTWADSPDFAPERAIDGNDATMWLVPNGETGFLEVRFVPGRRVERVQLTNAGSAGVPDRGTHEYSLEIWVDGAVARTIDGAFIDELGARAEHEIGIDDVERIRFLIRSHYRISGGLAELRWE